MKFLVEFKKEDFSSMRDFTKAVQKQLGNNCYVGTDSLCLYFDYPKELRDMLRPNPPHEQLIFELGSDK